MSFSPKQIQQLRAPVKRRHIKDRCVDGKTLRYLEGWQVIAEANRIFGFDCWDRETVSSECVWRTPVEGGFAAAYLTRVRLRVRAGESEVVREGLGSGEATGPTPGQAHERASKAAETDATKRALSTFGNPFGLSLYGGRTPTTAPARPEAQAMDAPMAQTPAPAESAPDLISGAPSTDSTQAEAIADGRIALLPVHLPPQDLRRGSGHGAMLRAIDKSVLAIGEPKRIRSPEHLRRVGAQPCLICGRNPSQAHHLRFAQMRALGRKVSDEFTVPLCATHHQQLHAFGNEVNWWANQKLDPIPIAEGLWRETCAGEPLGRRSS